MATDEDGFAQRRRQSRGRKLPCRPVTIFGHPPRLAVDSALDIRTAQNVLVAFEPASVGERLLATVLDGVVVAAYLIVGAQLLESWNLTGTAVFVIFALPIALYHLAFETLLDGQTPGKRALGLRVARLDGVQPTLGQYVLRWLLRWVDVSLSGGTVALLAIVLTPRSQRLGDLAAGTTVVRRRRRVRLGEVLYPHTEAGYQAVFADAATLTDADVRTLRAVLVRLRTRPRDRESLRLAQRAKAAVEARLGLERVALPPEAFLATVVRDHTFLLDQWSESPVPR